MSNISWFVEFLNCCTVSADTAITCVPERLRHRACSSSLSFPIV